MHLVVRSIVHAELVLKGVFEQQIGMECRIEFYIIVSIHQGVQVVVAALIPVGRHVCLRELQIGIECFQPVFFLELSLKISHRHLLGYNFSDEDTRRCGVHSGSELFRRLREMCFVVLYEMGVIHYVTLACAFHELCLCYGA